MLTQGEQKKQKILKRINEHLDSALSVYDCDWFAICLQGSQNYGLDDSESDVDTKLLVIPTFEQICLNKKPVSTTHIMENDEHCDVKDVREYFRIFRKQNINFVEILFTDYFIVNEKYIDEWNELVNNKELIARYNERAALKCMIGMMYEKMNALCKEYPSRISFIKKFGYDPKQLQHILRINAFIKSYVAGKPYGECLNSPNKLFMKAVKRGEARISGPAEAINIAEASLEEAKTIVDKYLAEHDANANSDVDYLFDSTLMKIMSKSLNIK